MGAALAVGGAALVGVFGVGELGVAGARAEGAASAGCVLRGATPMAKGAEIWDAAAGGKALARFTGAPVELRVSEIPADGGGRARVATSTGQGLRIEGYLSTASVPTFTVRDVAVVPSHVWITAAQRVRVVGATEGALTVERTVAGSAGQVVRGTAACVAFALAPAGRRPVDVPGDGRGYTMKEATLDVFPAPGGASVFTLRMTDASGELFWSTESRGGFVRVASRGDLDGPRLALDPLPAVVRATRDVPVRAHRDERERPIGVVEAGAEIYVMDTVPPFTSVLPKGLGVMPADEVAFWILTSDVPK